MTVEPLFEKKVDCLLCKESFTTKKVRSSFKKARAMQSDFYTEYVYEDEVGSPLYYYVTICPSCGYAFTEDSNPYFHPRRKQDVIEKVSAYWKGNDRYSYDRTLEQALQTYKLALYSGQIKEEREIVMAGLHMRLMWLYRKLGQQEEEERYLNYALQAYERSYYVGDYQETDMSLIQLTYIIGELYRRLGQFQKAGSYFSQLLYLEDDTRDLKYIKMAKEQWQVMREQQREIEWQNQQNIS
ncbi:DUF2225 domain-containing protein [Bacillus alkalicellulosilyticus]|uniref:DUF2225 domain-containing protein n=1 Tax=Alkalihalobacterium alkalicellulosilyticum TaxID=1912214 RepID=UPI0009963630|nr:DUF2225 domain-containing protein [Bacillus alkalicellulosilyticus]